MRRSRRWIALTLALAMLLASCSTRVQRRMFGKTPIIVASADEVEQRVVGKMTVLALESAGFVVADKTDLGSPWMVRAALAAGNIDVCWDYTGDVWSLYLRHDHPISDPEELYQKVRDEDALNQITWLHPAPSQRGLGLVMAADAARQRSITSISDLADHMNHVDPDLSLCTPRELCDAAYGIRGLERVYGVRFSKDRVRFMSTQDGCEAVAREECDCALGYPSDVVLVGALCLLVDNRGFFQASSLAPAVRTPILTEFPDLAQILGEISQLLTQEAMAEFRRQVTVDGKRPETVARRFLRQHGVFQ